MTEQQGSILIFELGVIIGVLLSLVVLMMLTAQR